MSERTDIEVKIAQCRRFLAFPTDPLTTERIKALLAELQQRLQALS
jgi:hypothetical protein